MRIEMVMPQMGESITEGTVVRWTKKIGEMIARDENILDISTDKVDSEIPAPAAGRLVEIRAQEGETIPVGQVIAVIETEVGAASSAPPPASAPAPAPVPVPPPPIPAAPAQAPAPAPVPIPPPPIPSAPVAPVPSPLPSAPVVIPPVPPMPGGGPIPHRDGERFYSPLVRSIARADGVSVAELASIRGSGRDGRVTKDDLAAFVEARRGGTPVPVRSADSAASPVVSAAAAASAPAGGPAGAAVPAGAAAAATWSGSSFFGPSGGGEVRFKAYPSYVPAETRDTADGPVEVVKMDVMRQRIAEHMVRSKATSPHVASVTECDMTGIVRFREATKGEFERIHGFKLTYTPFIVAAAVRALLDYPMMNASVEGTEILVKRFVNVGVAVALDNGLIVPVVKQAQEKNFLGLARAIADLAARARTKKLVPDEVAGGTFAVTNMGGFGNLFGLPIINQPNVGILGAGAIVKRPVVLGEAIAVRDIMYLSLSYDHRVVDGALGGYFIQRVRHYLEKGDMVEGV
jgi:pyruvate/2-oxoglutarate dehydrogenase complex dihydrolipoamide acyltransferase (E2) component